LNRDNIDLLMKVPLLSGLSAEELRLLERHAAVRSYRKQTVMIEKGDEANALYIILSGGVKVFASDSNGKEITLNQLGPGEYVGELAIIDGAARAASVVTLEDSSFLVVQKAAFQDLLAARPDVAFRLLVHMVGRVRTLTKEIESLALRDVYGRVADTLTARARMENDRLITDAMTQRDIANLTGASREMVSRIFKDLKAGGYVALEGKRVVILRKLPARW
jgi:CRP/FNR family cyclic AMP-dependent transcriptional regulator